MNRRNIAVSIILVVLVGFVHSVALAGDPPEKIRERLNRGVAMKDRCVAKDAPIALTIYAAVAPSPASKYVAEAVVFGLTLTGYGACSCGQMLVFSANGCTDESCC